MLMLMSSLSLSYYAYACAYAYAYAYAYALVRTRLKADTLGTRFSVRLREVSRLRESSVTEKQVKIGKDQICMLSALEKCPL